MLEITVKVYPVQIYRENPAGVLVGWCDEPALAGSTAALEAEKSMLLFYSLPAFLVHSISVPQHCQLRTEHI